MDLVEALKTQPRLVQAHLAKHVDVEQDPFAALNTAFLHDGAVVHVIGKDAALPVVQLLFVSTDAQQQQVSHPRALLVTGLHAKLTLVETYVSLGTHANFTNTVTEIAVGEGSTVDHYKLLLENPAGFHVGTTQVDVGKDGTYNTWSFARGTALARNDLTINLSGHGAGTRLNGLHLTRGNEHIDNAINIDHQQPYTTSWQYVKGILAEDSHAVYTGRVVIQRPAVKSLAQQADKNLLLSDNAEVDTKPSMEIWCDDVKASHGATAGQIAEAQEAMFYMQSRGIDRETASKLLVRGFANEVLQTVSLRPLHAFLEKLLDTALPEFQFQGK
jgi:Fe-S cluster assembly protein SufD